MVDKMWFDWQHAHVEENFYLIEGGLTPHIENATIYAQYTTGGPPALDVSAFGPSKKRCLTSRSSTPPCPTTACGRTSLSGMS